MTEPFLILHKVRGEAAFDIAIQMTCPICKEKWEHEDWVCGECNGDEYWWIIPTSGHRAYPYFNMRLEDCTGPMRENSIRRIHTSLIDMPDEIQDHCHYELDRDKSPIASSDVQRALASLMKPQAPIRRRL